METPDINRKTAMKIKQLSTSLIFLFLLFSCNEETQQEDIIMKGADTTSLQMSNYSDHIRNEFIEFDLFSLNDTIVIDLNGDSISDCVYFIENNGKKALLVFDGRSKVEFQVGQDESFADIGDDFSWVDFWGITSDTQVYEIVITDGEIEGERNVSLLHPSLVLRKDEVGGGVITFIDNKFIWIHQAD